MIDDPEDGIHWPENNRVLVGKIQRPLTVARARLFLAIAAAVIAACAMFIGYELGKATPCTDVESFDFQPLQ